MVSVASHQALKGHSAGYTAQGQYLKSLLVFFFFLVTEVINVAVRDAEGSLRAAAKHGFYLDWYSWSPTCPGMNSASHIGANLLRSLVCDEL